MIGGPIITVCTCELQKSSRSWGQGEREPWRIEAAPAGAPRGRSGGGPPAATINSMVWFCFVL